MLSFTHDCVMPTPGPQEAEVSATLALPSWAEPLPPLAEDTVLIPHQDPPHLECPTLGLPALDPVQLGCVLRARDMVAWYREHGYRYAACNPLDPTPPQASWTDEGGVTFSTEEYASVVPLPSPFQGCSVQAAEHRLQNCYLGRLGVDYHHVDDLDARTWIRHMVETPQAALWHVTDAQHDALLTALVHSDQLDTFLQTHFPGTTRFSAAGADGVVAALGCALDEGHLTRDVSKTVLAASHRGRLHLMAQVLGAPLTWILSRFTHPLPLEPGFLGDVTYHQGGVSETRILLPNAAHLESVGPVLLGRVRAIQDSVSGPRTRILSVALHGDASFVGQGSVWEMLCLGGVEKYSVGGTVHILINNQVGFTATPQETRGTRSPSDGVRGLGIPVIHVNGNVPEAVLKALRLAIAFRQRFERDVVVDVVCYRRYGHNEGDDPTLTQPIMYQKIRALAKGVESYTCQLIESGLITAHRREQLETHARHKLDEAFAQVKAQGGVGTPWAGASLPTSTHPPEDPPQTPGTTGVHQDLLVAWGDQMCHVPEGFHLHHTVSRILDKRRQMCAGSMPVDWAMAEALGFASLLTQGVGIRLSGEDSVRGTFSQRHGLWIDQVTEKTYAPFDTLNTAASLQIINSPLSEMGVLGFEWGYSVQAPQKLVIWEAQYGDFVNGAQVVIDEYIVSGQTKWGLDSRLVLLLPHGYDGQGADHSSARLERFLQVAAGGNIRIANCTTPANYFHLLRQHMTLASPCPLIVMAPKSLLRNPQATSRLAEFGEGTCFQPVLADVQALDHRVRKIVMCTGKIYYDLLAKRQDTGQDQEVALIRLELLAPLPLPQLMETVGHYQHTGAFLVWCQEEPVNAGAWGFLEPHLRSMCQTLGLEGPYVVARDPAPAPATGYGAVHAQEQDALLEAVFSSSLASSLPPFSSPFKRT